jgi:hypothetical protein
MCEKGCINSTADITLKQDRSCGSPMIFCNCSNNILYTRFGEEGNPANVKSGFEICLGGY